MTTRQDWNRFLIEEFRANGGKVGGTWEGRPLLLLTTTGAKSGQRHTNPTMYLDLIPGQMSDMYKWPQRSSS